MPDQKQREFQKYAKYKKSIKLEKNVSKIASFFFAFGMVMTALFFVYFYYNETKRLSYNVKLFLNVVDINLIVIFIAFFLLIIFKVFLLEDHNYFIQEYESKILPKNKDFIRINPSNLTEHKAVIKQNT